MLGIFMSPNLQGGGHIVFGADLIGISVGISVGTCAGVTLFSSPEPKAQDELL